MGANAHRCAGAILVRNGTVLLCHRSPDRDWFPNVWDIPGGHVEEGETSAATVVRELNEELGITASVSGEPFAVIEDAELSLSMEVWRIDTWEGTPINRATHEHDRIGWFAPSEVTALALADESYQDFLAAAVDLKGG
jgi:mutator protein MutT